MKLGVYLPVYGGWIRGIPVEEPKITTAYVLECVKEAENLGFDSVWVPDHFLNPIKGELEPCIESWTILTAAAAVTKRITVAHTTLCQSFRHPAILAKMAATLDEISEGRFIFSIGAGWYRREYEAYGLPWFRHDERIEQAEEQIKLIKLFWTQDKVNFQGKYYTVKDGIMLPKPYQKPRPQIWYGGESERSRQLVANEADVWLMNGGSPEDTLKKIEDMKPRLRGREIGYSLPAIVSLGATDAEVQQKLANKTKAPEATSLNKALQTTMIGSPATLKAQLKEYEKIGITALLLQFGSTLEEMREFARQVM